MSNDPAGLTFADVPVGPDKRLFLLTYSPNGERALVGSTSVKSVAAAADDIARDNRLYRNACDIRAATEADLEAGDFIEVLA